MKKKSLVWKIILIVSILPFVITVLFGIYKAITGLKFLCITNCVPLYGFEGFIMTLILYGIVWWPLYLISFILFIISLIFIIRYKKRRNKK